MEKVGTVREGFNPSRPVSWLVDEQRFWFSFSLVLGAVALMKGLRLPNLWSAGQSMLDYHLGFIKRGFFGATLGRMFHVEHYTHFVALSFILLFILSALLVLLSFRMGSYRNLSAAILSAVFFASFTVTYLAHLVGYLDIPLAILTIALLLVRNTTYRFLLALPVCFVGLLIHELYLVVFLPVVLLTFVVDALHAKPQRQRNCLWMAAALLFVCLGLTVRLALNPPMTVDRAARLQADITQRTDYPIRPDFFQVLTLSTAGNVKLMLHTYTSSQYLRQQAASLLLSAPTLLLLLYGIRRALALHPPSPLRRFATAAAVVAALSPLAMNLIGWDYGRFNALAGLTSMLVLAVVLAAAARAPLVLPPWYRNAAIVAIAISMASGEGMMDYVTPSSYPFSQKADSLVKRIVRHHWDPPAR